MPIYMYQWPPPRIKGAYCLHKLPQASGEGNPAVYCWARKHLIKIIEAATYRAHRELGPSPCPLVVYDSSTAQGTTPPGRHPSGAHNATGSVSGNVDLGYYLREWMGSVCPGRSVNNALVAPPANLDVEREEVFFFVLGEIDRAIGGSNLIRMCCVDPQIEPIVDGALSTSGRERSAVLEGIRICFSDSNPANGWAKFHDSHHHLRLQGLDNDDEIADYIEQVWIAPLLVEKPQAQLVVPKQDQPEVGCHDESESEPEETSGEDVVAGKLKS